MILSETVSFSRKAGKFMSKNWYPDVDHAKCIDCGYCIDLCEHDVYEKIKSPVPVVAFPQRCLEGCKYCGVMCPGHAIRYIADGTEYNCGSGRFCNCC